MHLKVLVGQAVSLKAGRGGHKQLYLVLASSVGRFGEKTPNLLEVLIILFVNNHLLLSDQEPAWCKV